MRKLAIVVIVSAMLIGAGLGTLVYAMAGLRDRQSVAIAAPAPAVTPTKAPSRDPYVVGTVGHFTSETVVFVERLGVSAWNRAYADRDSKGEARVFDVFEHYTIASSVAVRVVSRVGDIIQFEIQDGRDQGRRGWTDLGGFTPEP